MLSITMLPTSQYLQDRCPWIPLQWRHNQRDGASNHQPHDCLLNRLFRQRWKKTSKLRVTGLSAPRVSHAENISNWWRHHALGNDDMANHYRTGQIHTVCKVLIYCGWDNIWIPLCRLHIKMKFLARILSYFNSILIIVPYDPIKRCKHWQRSRHCPQSELTKCNCKNFVKIITYCRQSGVQFWTYIQLC